MPSPDMKAHAEAVSGLRLKLFAELGVYFLTSCSKIFDGVSGRRHTLFTPGRIITADVQYVL
jgi:hypothetical protein